MTECTPLVIYQFISVGMFPKMKGNIFFLSKDKGGLGLLNIAAQQKSLQFRYIKALLEPSGIVLPDIPQFLYDLLAGTIQLSYDTPAHELPLLIQSARLQGTLRSLHPFTAIFEALDSCKIEPLKYRN
jgi:hypothetical protein